MLDISVLLFVLFAIAFIFVTVTYIHYAVHKYINKDLICYIENNVYLIRYDIIDTLIVQTKNLNTSFEYLDTYFDYLNKYLYKKYIERISE